MIVYKIDFKKDIQPIPRFILQRLLEQKLNTDGVLKEKQSYEVKLNNTKKALIIISHSIHRYENNSGETRFAVRGEKIGGGKYGEVYEVIATIKITQEEGLQITYDRHRKYPLALKLIQRSFKKDSAQIMVSQKRKIAEESKLLWCITHVKPPTLFGKNLTEKTIYSGIFMERYEARDLEDYIHERLKKGILEKVFVLSACYTMLAVCSAMEWMHKKGVVQLDVKPENIIYDPVRVIAAFVDMGLAKKIETDAYEVGGNAQHLPPEVSCKLPDESVRIDVDMDIFGLAGVLAQILCIYNMRSPDTSKDQRYKDDDVLGRIFVPYNLEKLLASSPQVSDKTKTAFKKLIEKMGAEKREDRPNLQQIMDEITEIKKDEIAALLKKGVKNLNLKDERFFPGVFYGAVARGDTELIKEFIRNGIDVDIGIVGNYSGKESAIYATPLFIAAQNGQAEVVEILLNAGAAVNKPTSNQRILLYMNLQKYGDKCNSTLADSFEGYTPLHIAALNGCEEVVKVLLMHKDIKVNILAKDGSTPLYLATLAKCQSIVEQLLIAGADPNSLCKRDQMTPLIFALLQEDKGLITALLSYGADVDFKTPKFGSARELAEKKEWSKEFEQLIQAAPKKQVASAYAKIPVPG